MNIFYLKINVESSELRGKSGIVARFTDLFDETSVERIERHSFGDQWQKQPHVRRHESGTVRCSSPIGDKKDNDTNVVSIRRFQMVLKLVR